MVAKQLAEILGIPPRADGTQIVGDLGSMPDVTDNHGTPCCDPVQLGLNEPHDCAAIRPPTLGPTDAPARISHNLMIAGSDHAAEPSERIDI